MENDLSRITRFRKILDESSMNFKKFVDEIELNNWNVFGTEVYINGELKYSYGDTTGLHEIYSATKTILSIAVGVFFDEGMIDLDRPITDYLPQDKVKAMVEKQYNSFNKISIRRLLTMSVKGFPFRPQGDNWLDYSLACEINPDDTGFDYSNVGVYLVGVALANILGDDLGRFIEERILKPLNITSYEYGRSPEGYFYGASQMRLSVHDLSKFGLLLYNKGVYNGNRIISEAYVDMATSRQQINREGGYGFYIWKYRGGFSINGKWKQKCYVLPKLGVIVTFLSNIDDDSNALIESMEKNIFGIGLKEKKAFERIEKMEELFDKVKNGNRNEQYLNILEKYYTSDDWKTDFSLDESGLLPANLKCGVLSEDGIYNLLFSVQNQTMI